MKTFSVRLTTNPNPVVVCADSYSPYPTDGIITFIVYEGRDSVAVASFMKHDIVMITSKPYNALEFYGVSPISELREELHESINEVKKQIDDLGKLIPKSEPVPKKKMGRPKKK